MDAPKGYVHDPRSGKYYHILEVTDAAGSSARLITWFDPQTGSFTYVTEQTSPPPEMPQLSAAPTEKAKKRSKKPIIIAAIAVILTAAAAVAVWQLGLLDTLFSAQSAPASSNSSTASSNSGTSSASFGNGASSSQSSTSQSLPKASDFVRGDSSSSGPYTPPETVPEGLSLNTWYLGFVNSSDGGLVRNPNLHMFNFWRDGRFTISYEFLCDKGYFVSTNLYGPYRIEGNKIYCTVKEFLEVEAVQNLKPEDFPEFIFEASGDGSVICIQGDPNMPLDGVIFHKE